MNPEDATAFNNRGNTYDELERYEEALGDYGRAIELNPEYATAHYNTACVYALMGDVAAACDWLRRSIALDAKYQQMASTDSDFDAIRDNAAFRAVVGDN